MKKLFTLMIAVAAMISFTACEKDGGKDLPNEIIIGSESYTLNAACCYCYTDPDYETLEYNFWLTDRRYWNNDGDWPIEDSNYANGLEVNLYNLYAKGVAKGSLPTGKFTYGDPWENFKHNGYSDYTLNDEDGDTNWIGIGQDCEEESKLTIEIKHIKGNIYEIIFTGGVDVYGKPVNGYYKGAVDVYNSNDLK